MSSKTLHSDKVEAIIRALEFVQQSECVEDLEKEIRSINDQQITALNNEFNVCDDKIIELNVGITECSQVYQTSKKGKLKIEIELLERQKTEMLASFKQAKQVLGDRKKRIEQKILSLKNTCTLLQTRDRLSREGCCPMLLNPLMWRLKDTPLPMFWLFDPFGSSIGKFTTNYPVPASYWITQPEIPKNLKDTLLKTNDFHHYHDAILSTSFAANRIPDHIRERVMDLRNRKVFDHIFFLAEVVEWKVRVVSRPEDPIVVGWCEKLQQLYYIDHFDLTEHEAAYLKDTPAFQLAQQIVEQARSK